MARIRAVVRMLRPVDPEFAAALARRWAGLPVAHLLFGMMAAFFAAIWITTADTWYEPARQSARPRRGCPATRRVNRPRQEAGCGTFWLCQVAETPAARPGGWGVCLTRR